MKLDTQAFLNSLVFMGEGMLGIFAVMLMIIGLVTLVLFATKKLWVYDGGL